MPKTTEDFKKMLPSKKFVRLMSICIGICVIILIIASYVGTRSSFSKPALSVGDNTTLGELLVQDSNSNGIPDWEESLYGLDPKGDGISNKTTIDTQKLKVQKENGITNTANLDNPNETSRLSHEMLSTILALQQSGNLTPEAVQNLSASLGQTIQAKRDNTPAFTINNMKIIEDNSDKAMLTYGKAFNTALLSANKNGMGRELNVIYQGLDEANGKDAIKNLDPYIAMYAKLATDLVAIQTPSAISQKMLALANASAMMARALQKIELMYSDAAAGLVGFDEYTIASASFENAIIDAADAVVN